MSAMVSFVSGRRPDLDLRARRGLGVKKWGKGGTLGGSLVLFS